MAKISAVELNVKLVQEDVRFMMAFSGFGERTSKHDSSYMLTTPLYELRSRTNTIEIKLNVLL